MAFKLRHKKSGGREKGVPNKNTVELRLRLRDVLEMEIDKIPSYLNNISDTRIRLELIIKLMPFVFPKMQTINLLDAKEVDPFSWG